MHPTELDALYAFLAAAVITAVITPLTMRFARAVRAVDEPRERGLSERPVPLLGGLAIFAGTLVAALVWLPASEPDGPNWHGVLLAAAVITVVGAIDDRFELHPALKLAGQVIAAVVAVHFGVVVKDISVPFVGLLQFPNQGGVITVIGLVALM
ncbi:MAG: undecaprenyl/decaprenyl-phosphate alpha-N-acetylglucosaminyl 1-phosphate transferase, partial [Solirubrobacteraceae bacterium]